MGLWWDPFIQSKKCMSLKFTGELCHENEVWFEIWRGIDSSVQNWHEECEKLWPRALENLKTLHLNGLLLIKVYNVLAKKATEELCLMALRIYTKFEGKLTCTF